MFCAYRPIRFPIGINQIIEYKHKYLSIFQKNTNYNYFTLQEKNPNNKYLADNLQNKIISEENVREFILDILSVFVGKVKNESIINVVLSKELSRALVDNTSYLVNVSQNQYGQMVIDINISNTSRYPSNEYRIKLIEGETCEF